MSKHMILIFLALCFSFCKSPNKSGSRPTDPTQTRDGQVEVKYFHNDPESATFTFKFFYQNGTDSSLPVIVFLSGGPGDPVDYAEMRKEYPEEFGLLTFSPRGIKQNKIVASGLDPLKLFTTQNLAHDVAAILKALDLKNYIIHGVSYGTTHATVLTDLLQKKGMPLPKAVVLEGAVGRALESREEEFQTQLSLWPMIREKVSKERFRELAQLDPKSVDKFIWGGFYFGPPWLTGVLLQPLDQLKSDMAKLNRIIDEGLLNMDRHFMHRSIWCQELGDTESERNFTLDAEGNLGVYPLSSEENKCSEISRKKSFDAKNFSMSTKVYYLRGEYDAATPGWQTTYHKKNIQNAEIMNELKFPERSHSILPLETNCNRDLWYKVARGLPVSSSITKCSRRQMDLTDPDFNSDERWLIKRLRRNVFL